MKSLREEKTYCNQCKCELPDDYPLSFSCNHKVCGECICNVFFENGLKDIYAKEILTISCGCEVGKCDIELRTLYEIIEETINNKKSNECEKHLESYSCYCKECKMYLCPKCLTLFHNDYFKNHAINSTRPKDKITCIYHCNSEANYFCVDCNKEICKLCTLNTGAHFEHKTVTIEGYVEDFMKKKNKIMFKDFETFKTIIDEKRQNIKENVNNEIYTDAKKFDDLIEYITEIKNNHISDMETQLAISYEMLDLILLIFQHFFNLIEESPTPHLIKYYMNLNSQFKEHKVFLKTNTEIINKITLLLENFITQKNDNIKKEPFIYCLNFNKKETIVPKKIFPRLKGSIISLLQLQDGNIITGLGSGENSLKLWDINTLKCKKTIKGFSWGLVGIIQLKDGRICTGSSDNMISLWEYDSFANIGEICCHSGHVRSLIQLSDESKIISCGDDATIKICDIDKLKSVFSLSGHTKSVNRAIQLSDERIVSCSKDKMIKIWDLKSQKVQLVLKGHSAGVNDIIELFSGQIASCAEDKTIKVWEGTNGKCLYTLQGHESIVFKIIQLNDGRLASVSKDATIRLWDLTREKNIVTVIGHKDAIYTILQLNDGDIITGSRDQNVKCWDIGQF